MKFSNTVSMNGRMRFLKFNQQLQSYNSANSEIRTNSRHFSFRHNDIISLLLLHACQQHRTTCCMSTLRHWHIHMIVHQNSLRTTLAEISTSERRHTERVAGYK